MTDQRADLIAKSTAKEATQLLLNSIKDTASTAGSTSDSMADFSGFNMCQTTNSAAFNLANVGIPSTWLLLDSESTCHLIVNPDLLTNIREVEGRMAVKCNAGVAHLIHASVTNTTISINSQLRPQD